jgi:hypothetical protein
MSNEVILPRWYLRAQDHFKRLLSQVYPYASATAFIIE